MGGLQSKPFVGVLLFFIKQEKTHPMYLAEVSNWPPRLEINVFKIDFYLNFDQN